MKPTLTLHMMESKEIAEKEIVIFPQGYNWSDRSGVDGVTVFGTYDGSTDRSKDLIQIKTCDYVVQERDTGFGYKHFCIYFEPQYDQYKIFDLYQGSGTFF